MISMALVLLVSRATAATPGDGDLNGDTKLTAADRNLLRDYLSGKATLSADQRNHADVNGDTRVDVADLVGMVNKLKGTVTIDVTPNGGSWTLSGPAGFAARSGSGDRSGSSALTGLPVGDYTLTCTDTLSGYVAPAAVKLTLQAAGSTIAFTPVFIQIATLNIGATASAGTINSSADVDWYQFAIATAGSYIVETWTGTLADTALDLYGPNTRATLLETSDNVGTSKAAKIIRTLAVGTYFIRVRGVGGTGNYTIQVRANVVAPVIGSFSINNGAASATGRNVTLNNTCTGSPTNYMASESSAFTGASWQTYAAAPSFTLSSGNAAKTVYFKVRNAAGQVSAAVSDTITLNEQPGDIVTLTLAGGVSLALVKCPAGSFRMGSLNTERGRDIAEGPTHTVNLSKVFYMGKYEVTQAQWKAVMGNNPSYFQPSRGYTEDLTRPVEQVSWDDIAGSNGFIAKLNAYLASTGQGGKLRLPTEAEWEYACRAGTTTRFYFGDALGSDDLATDSPTGSTAYPGKRSDYMWFKYNCQGDTNGAYGAKPVGKKKPNAFGLYDMSGNVWEWCQDWYGDYTSASVTDPKGPASGSYRMFRGGGWYTFASNGRSAYRLYSTPDYRYLLIGFRLVWTN